MARRLSPQMRRFVSEYMLRWDATEAAQQAGYSSNNTSVGSRLLKHPMVADEVRRRCMATQKRLEINGDDVRNGLARIATDPREEEDGGPSHIARIMAWRELGKLLGLYTSKIEVRGSITLVDLLAAADRRTAEQTAEHSLPSAADSPSTVGRSLRLS